MWNISRSRDFACRDFFAPVDSDWLVWRLGWLPFQLNLVIPTVWMWYDLCLIHTARLDKTVFLASRCKLGITEDESHWQFVTEQKERETRLPNKRQQTFACFLSSERLVHVGTGLNAKVNIYAR